MLYQVTEVVDEEKKLAELWTWRQVDYVLADTHIAAINSDYMMICRANQSCGRGTRLESSVGAMTSIDVGNDAACHAEF